MVRKAAGVEEAVDPEAVAHTQAEVHAAALAQFGWAVNAVKLNRAKAWVNVQKPGLTGKDLEAAVKARYTELGGLLTAEAPHKARGSKAGARVQNMSAHDGTADDESDN